MRTVLLYSAPKRDYLTCDIHRPNIYIYMFMITLKERLHLRQIKNYFFYRVMNGLVSIHGFTEIMGMTTPTRIMRAMSPHRASEQTRTENRIGFRLR